MIGLPKLEQEGNPNRCIDRWRSCAWLQGIGLVEVANRQIREPLVVRNTNPELHTSPRIACIAGSMQVHRPAGFLAVALAIHRSERIHTTRVVSFAMRSGRCFWKTTAV